MSALTTLSVVTSVSPTFISTVFGNFINRKPRKQKPTSHLRYELGLAVIRSFLENLAKHPVEAIQSFTSSYVPVSPWVRLDQVTIPDSYSEASANHIRSQFGEKGLAEVGGSKWWTWRGHEPNLKADWIEMQTDYQARGTEKSNRILFYIHGGAYYFGSTDEHRYQIQRHARKLKARAFAPRYRLAPQYPFPCGLYDCLAAYLYILNEYDPKTILFAGDSAGGGMTVALLCLIRDQGLPLPAGAMLLSPWLDLTHSFPSILGDGLLDYIPIHGFVHKPSIGWPPAAIESYSDPDKEDNGPSQIPIRPDWIPAHVKNHHIMPHVEADGHEFFIKEQIQLYAPNHLLFNPYVSPVLQPSLGGLPPLLVQTGGGELISDEQVYFAHKAANPLEYPPSDEILDRWDPDRSTLNKYPPTNVQLQVWNDVCHVPHTLAWTKPAKYMYRSVAQFGAWALARAQQVEIDIDDDEDSFSNESERNEITDENAVNKAYSNASKQDITSIDAPKEETNGVIPNATVSNGNAIESVQSSTAKEPLQANPMYTANQTDTIGKTGDPLPPFVDNMIRQRVDHHGNIYPLSPPHTFFSLKLAPEEIGSIKEGAVHRWLERKEKWHILYRKAENVANLRREKLEAVGLPDGFENEKPPPSAYIRRAKGDMARKKDRPTKKRQQIIGLTWWAKWSSKQDSEAMESHIPPTLPASNNPTPAIRSPVPAPATSMITSPNGLALNSPNNSLALSPPNGLALSSPKLTSGSQTPRRKSAIVSDQGQADHAAIHSRPTSPSDDTEGPRQVFASNLAQNLARVPINDDSQTIQIPTQGALGGPK